ncbi:MAG: Holliday junction branch migration protein RuvA [Alicyclobacillaceae bacterium]|nr:Holliday junction branch migration protein RuvA [Alicyclobacillaceae bacterium]
MIAFLRGRVAEVASDHVVLDVHGVGYKVWVPEGLALRLREGEEVTLHTHCALREEGAFLFGFLQPKERDFFTLLQEVPGIGPKVALAVVGAGVDAVAAAVAREDVSFLRSLPGVGRKTAERMIVDLREKVEHYRPQPAAEGGQWGEGAQAEDVVAALSSLGYNEKEIRSVWPALRKELEQGRPLEAVIRLALARLARGSRS